MQAPDILCNPGACISIHKREPTPDKPMTLPTLRSHFDRARIVATQNHPEMIDKIKAFRFYDLRAKAADDTSEQRGERFART